MCSGNNTSKRSKVTQPKLDTPQKMRSSKTLGWTSLRRPVPNGRQRGPYTFKCRCTTHYGGYIVVGSSARKQGNAQDTCWKCKGKTEKAQKKDCLPSLTHCGMDTVEGALIVGTVVNWFSGLAKGRRQLEPTVAVEENINERKPGITVVWRPC